MAASPPENTPTSRVPQWAFRTAYGLAAAVLLAGELPVWLDDGETGRSERLTGWLCGRTETELPFLPVLLAVPLLQASLGDRRRFGSVRKRLVVMCSRRHGESRAAAWVMALFVFLLGFLASGSVAQRFAGLPPAYHDEYSYLLQAETLSAGRWSYPSFPPESALFDQMHVLNEGRFASRYFPGNGAWIAPFFVWGDPWLGHRLAHGIAAAFVFLAGRELACAGVGLLAGFLLAVSPGVLLFSATLLAHQPTLLGLTGFLYGFLRWLRTRERWVLCLSGCGLAFAMVCRPMTAAGFALPMGLVFLRIWLVGDPRGEPFLRRTTAALLLGGPLLIGFGIVFRSNAQITGSAWMSPYQLYTDTYTPRHVYGFNNVLRGEQRLGPKVLDAYDRWADNLTPALALRNVGTRLWNSFRWTLGVVPLAFGTALWLLTQRGADPRWWLIGAAALSLHAVHVPYWFVGIMGWHYVFETAPLLLLLFAAGVGRLGGASLEPGGRFLGWTAGLLTATALATNLLTVPPLWPGQLPFGMAEIEVPRRRYAAFREAIEELRQGRDAVVFVIPDPADISMDYVTNPPSLDGPVLVARVRDLEHGRAALRWFPGREGWVYDARSRRFGERLPPPEESLP